MPAEPAAVAAAREAAASGTSDDAVLDAAVRGAVTHGEFALKFRHPVKFNGTDFVETRLSEEDIQAQVAALARTSPHIFLERYGSLVSRDDLHALSASSAAEWQSPEARFWIERLLREPPSDGDLRKRSRRRRWLWAKREMALPDGFFCEDAMKRRDPTLFNRLVGRHLASESLSGTAAMQGGLSRYLFQQLDRACEEDARSAALRSRGRGVKRRVASADDDDLEDPEAIDDCSDTEIADLEAHLHGAEDEVSGRERFLHVMRDRFVNGLEPNFEYAALDEDSDLEDVVELGRDAEERYFDDD